jgi:hypothetical protein
MERKPRMTFQQVVHTVGGATFQTYPCKYFDECPKANPALTTPVEIRGINGQPKILQKLCNCTHGGGVACGSWKYKSNKLLCGYDKPQNGAVPTQTHIPNASVCTVESKAVDSMGERLKKLSNIKMEEL